jgi:hypothetical protein
MIFTVALLAVLPATAQAIRGPLPPVFVSPPVSQSSQYWMHGTLTHYVPASGLTNGSITIRVNSATPTAAFALYKTLTFRITATTTVVIDQDGWINDGETGWVKLASLTRLTSIQALQAVPAGSVIDDRPIELPAPLDAP